nr:MAG TPA: hypothetical protein [Caudoviricetes sp.]
MFCNQNQLVYAPDFDRMVGGITLPPRELSLAFSLRLQVIL